MTPPDDTLDALLREALSTSDLPSGAFERRVVAALPRRSPALPLYPILIWLGGLSALAGLAYGIFLYGSLFLGTPAWVFGGVAAPWSNTAYAIAAASCLYAGWAALNAFGVRPPARR